MRIVYENDDINNGDVADERQRTQRQAEPRQAPRQRVRPSGAAGRKAQNPRRQQRAEHRQDGGQSQLLRFFLDKRTHIAIGIIFCVVATVMVVSSVSYIFNGIKDQSVLQGRTITEIVEAQDEIETAGGVVGAKLANLLLVDTFGIGSFVLAFYVFVLGLTLMGLRKSRFWSFSFKSLYSTATLSIVFGLLTYNEELMFNVGGNYGHNINTLLLQYGGALGAYAVSVILAGILVAIFLHPLKEFFVALSGLISKTFAKQKEISETPPVTEDENLASTLDDVEDEQADDNRDDEPIDSSVILEDDHSAELHEDTSVGGFSLDEDEDENTVAVGREQIRTQNVTKDPELVIVNSESRSGSTERVNVIRDGDHIGADQPYDHRAELSSYKFPTLDLLVERPDPVVINEEEQTENKNMIVRVLNSYGIDIARVEATVGPTVTLFEIIPAEGVRIAQIRRLEDDIALNLAALGIRIIAPIPGKGTIGIEVPNRKPQTVSIRSILSSEAFAKSDKMALPMALGLTISNDVFIADLARMPHLLVAGATGQGKSVGLNCIIASLLYKKHPSELKFVLVDPKMVEFSLYKRLQHHYLAKLPDEESPIVTSPDKAVATLESLCTEMDNRYALLSSAEVRSLEEYNRKFTQKRLNPEDGHRYLPYMVMIVDEFADLIMTAGKDVSLPIARIAQKGRAAGMHMIIATQRPSTDVITGMIKANFPGRIAFRVQQMVDSKTILDRPGANRLIGRGDMLVSQSGTIERVQCAFIDTCEIESLVEYIDNQIGYPTAYMLPEAPVGEPEHTGGVDISKRDAKFNEILRFVAAQNVASTSMLQSEFEIGFNRARRIMDQFYKLGIVGPQDGVRPRQVLISPDDVERIINS